MNQNWSKEELRASVEAYLKMQKIIRSGQTLVKKAFYQELAKKFGRTEKSYEYRMQNISYVLSTLGREWINGLKPARNVGTKVAMAIETMLAEKENRVPTTSLKFEVEVQLERTKKITKKPVGVRTPKSIVSQTQQFERDPKVKAWVLNAAKGHCENCGKAAPFKDYSGCLYLEVHHVRGLADGGSDTTENAVAICPNCHRELHYGEGRSSLVENLYQKITRLIPE